jgi:hypothetical protein
LLDSMVYHVARGPPVPARRYSSADHKNQDDYK